MQESFVIQPGEMLTYTFQGNCMDEMLAGPMAGEAVSMRRLSDRVPKELIPVMHGLGRMPESVSTQDATWAIMNAADLQIQLQHMKPEAIAQMDDAYPNGSGIFLDFLQKQVKAQENGGKPMKVVKSYPFAKGESDADGMGAGHTMIAPGVATRGVGAGNLRINVDVINASGEPFEFKPLDYYAHSHPRGRQGVSPTMKVGNATVSQVPVSDANGATLDSFVDAEGDVMLRFLFDQGVSNSFKLGSPGIVNTLGKFKPFRDAILKQADNAKFLPVVGNILSCYEAVTGKDCFTGGELSAVERSLAIIGSIPGGNYIRGGGIAMAKLSRVLEKTEGQRILAGWVASGAALEGVKAIDPSNEVLLAYKSALELNDSTKQWLERNA